MFFEEASLPAYFAPILIIIQLIFLEGILSIDNAAVLGAMVSVLPDHEPTPYPPLLKFMQPFTDQVLGMQQQAALKVGLLGAYLGRGLMLVMASFVIANPWLRLLGAFYLIKLAFENLAVAQEKEGSSAAHGHRAVAASFWLVVLNVELADLAFSLDNVVAAVALSDELWVVLIGVALGIITMRFAAGIFTYLIRRHPILEPAAYILVLAIGIELVLADLYDFHFSHLIKFGISIGILAACLLYARFEFLRRFDPLLQWLGEGMDYLNSLVNWAFKPLLLLLKLLFFPLRRLFATEARLAQHLDRT
ncbi:MAG: tellurium resistance protein TerC [Anaerolineales bacterium]|nr:tellurium resistance protein TerC [Anaerolineales bacterium]